MAARLARRDVLKTGAVLGTTLGLGNLGFLQQLPPVAADETKLDPKVVRLDSGIEPLVQLIEQTPRDRLLEEIGGRIKKGLTYKEIVAALQLAGVRNVEPRPSVGFKFHCVLVVNSAHLAAQSTSDDKQRWLPIFWALDNFKSGQAQDEKERGWTMPPVDEVAVPGKDKARQAFLDAMQAWNEPAADAAIAGLVRTAEPAEIYELFFRLGSRDLRSIGHKSIYVANSFRALQYIGWQHAEPILRSLTYALLAREGSDPTQGDLPTDRPYKRNSELVKKIRDGWREGEIDEGATRSLIDALRTATPDAACDQVVELLNKKVSPQSIWDAMFVEAGELLMRQPAIVALHSVTTSNAVHVAYQTTTSDETRRLLLLQNAAFITMFRDQMKNRGKLADRSIDTLAIKTPDSEDDAVGEVFSTLGDDPTLAAGKALSLLRQEGRAKEIIDAARVLVFLKGNDSHDYKFSSAVLEDYVHVSPQWRNLYLASNLFNLRNSKEKDSGLVKRTEAAIG